MILVMTPTPDKCPWCDAKADPHGGTNYWLCDTLRVADKGRSLLCCERELAALKSQVEHLRAIFQDMLDTKSFASPEACVDWMCRRAEDALAGKDAP